MNVWIKTSCNTGVQTAGKNFQKDIYKPAEGTTGLWSHRTRPTKFALCVDDFGVKYFLKEDAEHLITTLKKNYIISED